MDAASSVDGTVQMKANIGYLAAMKQRPAFILDMSHNTWVLAKDKDVAELFNSTMADIRTYKLGLTPGERTATFLNPYSIFGPDSFTKPRGLPRNLSHLDKAHLPRLVEVHSEVVDRVVVLQSAISGLADVQHSATGWVEVHT